MLSVILGAQTDAAHERHWLVGQASNIRGLTLSEARFTLGLHLINTPKSRLAFPDRRHFRQNRRPRGVFSRTSVERCCSDAVDCVKLFRQKVEIRTRRVRPTQRSSYRQSGAFRNLLLYVVILRCCLHLLFPPREIFLSSYFALGVMDPRIVALSNAGFSRNRGVKEVDMSRVQNTRAWTRGTDGFSAPYFRDTALYFVMLFITSALPVEARPD